MGSQVQFASTWASLALVMLQDLVREKHHISADDIPDSVRKSAPNDNAIGILFNCAVRNKMLVRCGTKKSTRKEAKGHYIGVYRAHANYFLP